MIDGETMLALGYALIELNLKFSEACTLADWTDEETSDWMLELGPEELVAERNALGSRWQRASAQNPVEAQYVIGLAEAIVEMRSALGDELCAKLVDLAVEDSESLQEVVQ